MIPFQIGSTRDIYHLDECVASRKIGEELISSPPSLVCTGNESSNIDKSDWDQSTMIKARPGSRLADTPCSRFFFDLDSFAETGCKFFASA